MEDGQTASDKCFGVLVGGLVIPLWSPKDEARMHHFGAKMGPRIFDGCVVHAGGGGTGDCYKTNT